MSEVDLNRPAERVATIDLAAIRHNIAHVRDVVGSAQVMAVVKADAYGHGVVPVAAAALEAGATWLGAVHVSEALALRAAGLDAPILSWLHTESTDFDAAIAAGVDLGVSGWELAPIAAAAQRVGATARIHLKIDTGLGRNGCTAGSWPGLLQQAKQLQEQGSVRVVGIFSHFAVADEPERPETDEQLEAFRAAVAAAEAAGLEIEVRHIANSPALLSRQDTHFDLVRCGLAMYGLSPFEDKTPQELGLRPAMRLSARIANVKSVPAGQGVSYGLRWHAQAPTTLGLIPLGYADGIPRVAENGPVLVNSRVVRAVGRVAMDQFVVDLGPDAAAEDYLGAEAVLFGGEGEPSVTEWAEAAGTINYEVVTRISPRVPRHHVDSEVDQDD
ncbi:MAG: alanine racemase [Galactobacter sp.]|uniref:alanine racemase n=1 Tax=Galactobacter sp. TaxID=2676125 RepID=UPI0025C553E5|nr:alanine racemase [Galactobacter sp.]